LREDRLEDGVTDVQQGAGAGVGPLRRVLLLLVVLSIVGLLVELLLLEHYEEPWQWAPLVLLVVALVPTAMMLTRPSRAVVLAFRAVMGVCLAAGALGILLHYRGNVEFERERDPSLAGWALVWEALRGATPSLAPGAMAQLGLLGLAAAWRVGGPVSVRSQAGVRPESGRSQAGVEARK
jgi:hypothetical protein